MTKQSASHCFTCSSSMKTLCCNYKYIQKAIKDRSLYNGWSCQLLQFSMSLSVTEFCTLAKTPVITNDAAQ